jgi:hypothetical protein
MIQAFSRAARRGAIEATGQSPHGMALRLRTQGFSPHSSFPRRISSFGGTQHTCAAARFDLRRRLTALQFAGLIARPFFRGILARNHKSITRGPSARGALRTNTKNLQLRPWPALCVPSLESPAARTMLVALRCAKPAKPLTLVAFESRASGTRWFAPAAVPRRPHPFAISWLLLALSQ